MHLSEEPEIVQWPETHYAFVEKTGPFPKICPEAWQTAHSVAPLLSEHNQVIGYMSLYKAGPNVYRAGFALPAPPVKLPAELTYEKFAGGKYSRFVLKGSYAHLPEASGRVWQIVGEKGVPVRDDFAIESYMNDPRVTPEEELLTEILVPTV